MTPDRGVPGGAGFRRAPGRGSVLACSYPVKRRECGYGSKKTPPRKYFVTTWHHWPQASPGHRGGSVEDDLRTVGAIMGPNGRWCTTRVGSSSRMIHAADPPADPGRRPARDDRD